MRILSRFCIAGVVALLCLSPVPSHAGPAVSFDSTTGFLLLNDPFTVGWQFAVNQPVSVGALGAYDSPFAEGLLNDHAVGIWNSSGQLIATATVHSGTSDPLTGRFRYANLATAVDLAPGIYTIGAFWPPEDDPNPPNTSDGLIFPNDPALTNFGTDPAITFLQPVFVAGGSLAEPTTSTGGATDFGYFGPNFLLTEAVPVPEPATAALFGGMLVGLGVLLRRRRPT